LTDLDALYRQYSADVFHFALYLSGDRHEAEDITSETFVRVWTASGPIRSETVKGFLFTIARNLFLQSRRGKYRSVEIEHDTLRDPAPDPEARAELTAQIRSVRAGLQTLSETDRAALLMRAVHGLSYEEIARALGLTLGATKVRIHRARLALLELRDSRGSS